MLPIIERVGEHAKEEWAIRMMANNLHDDLAPYVAKSMAPYFNALMNCIATHPDIYRRRGYTINNVLFSQHRRSSRGKLISCVADFGPEFLDRNSSGGDAAETGSAKPGAGRSANPCVSMGDA